MIHDAFRINRILHNDMDWDVFRSEVCHMYDSEPDIFFIEDVLRTNLIEALISNKWYEKALYILAMIDYVASKNEMPFYPDYDYLRTVKLPHIVFPKEILLLDSINNTNINKEKAIKDCKDHPCGKFFWRHNIIETYIENMNKQKGF